MMLQRMRLIFMYIDINWDNIENFKKIETVSFGAMKSGI
jgi:hypothetical protein